MNEFAREHVPETAERIRHAVPTIWQDSEELAKPRPEHEAVAELTKQDCHVGLVTLKRRFRWALKAATRMRNAHQSTVVRHSCRRKAHPGRRKEASM